jgi:hypothetical protein
MQVGTGIIDVVQVFGPVRVLENLVDEQRLAASLTKFLGEIDDVVLCEVKMVQVDVQTGTIGAEFLPGIFEQEGGLAHAATALDAYESVVPVDFIHQLPPNMRVNMFHQIFVGAVEPFHNQMYFWEPQR